MMNLIGFLTLKLGASSRLEDRKSGGRSEDVIEVQSRVWRKKHEGEISSLDSLLAMNNWLSPAVRN